MNELSETDRIKMGRAYMSLAIQYGYIELCPGHELYSAIGLKILGLKSPDGKSFPLDNDFYFQSEGYILSECYGPENVMDYIEGLEQQNKNGFILPIDYKVYEQ